MQPRITLEHFAQAYATAIGSLGNLRLDDGVIQGRIAEITALAGADGEVEDYTDEVFRHSEVRSALASIDRALPAILEHDRWRVISLVNDLLLTASLVPARETTSRDRSTLGTTKVYHRQAIEIMPLSLLTGTLSVLAEILADGDNPLDDQGIRPLRYNENDSLAQRLTSISLLNLKPETRTALGDSPTFQAMLDSDSLGDFLYASNGHDEQQFLTTCITSAVSTDVMAKTPTLVGLVEIGRGVARRVEENLQKLEDENPDVLDEPERSGLFGGSRTLRELVEQRLEEAHSEFDDIERQLGALASYTTGRTSAMPTDVLGELTGRWSRIMQKLSAVINVTQGVEGTAVWSKKRIAGTWLPSAVLAVPTLVDRPARRLGGIKAEYFEAIGSQVETRADFDPEYDFRIGEIIDGSPMGLTHWIPAFWQVAQEQGGVPTATETSVSEHHCYLKAVRRGGGQVFALSDPKVAGLTYLDFDEFLDWARSTGSKISTDVAGAALTLAGRLQRGVVPTDIAPITPQEAESDADEGSSTGWDARRDSSAGWDARDEYSATDGQAPEEGEPEHADAPHGTSDPWALARWELAGTDTRTLVHEQNDTALHELANDSWEPYWIADLSSVSVNAQLVVLIGYDHHEWFYDHLVDSSAPTGYILKERGRLGRHTWQASGTEECVAMVRDVIRGCGFKGTVTAHGADDASATVRAEVTFENHRALKELDRGDTIRYWISPDSLVLIGDGHLAERYADHEDEGRIRKGRKHYYVNGVGDSLDLVKQAIEETGSEREVVPDG
jgi:hypothetical protein